jgi:hypothetical protein
VIDFTITTKEKPKIAAAFYKRVCSILDTEKIPYDNKVIVSVPTSTASFSIWIYYTALNSMDVWSGYNARCWAKYQIGGEERLYYGKHANGVVYRALYGSTDEGTTTINGTAITMREITKKIDFGNALQRKEGHIFEIKGDAFGSYNVLCYAQFDDGGWESIGTFVPLGNYVDFGESGTDTVDFEILGYILLYDVKEVKDKFHIRSYGKFNYVQFKYVMSTAITSSDPLVITETNAVALLDPYMEE